jgi:peptidoglycan/LPS O-acetylase OafA/YrhL
VQQLPPGPLHQQEQSMSRRTTHDATAASAAASATRRTLTQTAAAAAAEGPARKGSAATLPAPRPSWSYSFAAGSEGQLTSQRCSEALTALLRHSFNLLPIVVESCSHPSGLDSLLLQPYSYAGGGLGNVDECPLLSCLALQPGRDGMPPYAGVCVPSECQASDLTSFDFVATLQRNLGSQQDLIASTYATGTATATRTKSAAQQRNAELEQQQQFQQQMELANEYVSVFQRINEINSFLPSGWTCGEWRFPIPLSGTTQVVWFAYLAMMYALLFGSVVGTYRGWQTRRHLRRRQRQLRHKDFGSDMRPREWDTSVGSSHEAERLLELRPVALHPTDDDCDSSSTAPNTPQTITPLSSSSAGSTTDDSNRRPLLSSLVSSHSAPEEENDDDDNDGTDLKPRVILPTGDPPCKDEDRRQRVSKGPAKRNNGSSVWSDFDLYEIHSRLVPEGTNAASATPPAQSALIDESTNHGDASVWTGTECLHGIRVLSVLWIVLGHTAAITSSTGPGYSNPGDVLPPHGWANTVAGQLIFASRFAVDTFLVLSGFLLVVAASKMSQATSTRPRTWPVWMVVSRIARIVPTYLTCLGIFVFVAPRYLGSGAFWYQWQSLLQPCTEYGWTNLLFVNNFYPTDTSTTNTCFYHSWYLAVDVQIFVLGVLLLVVYQRSRLAGLACASFLFVALTVMQAVLTHDRSWSLNTFDGAAVARYDVEAYAKPHVRAPSYLAGMICAMILIQRRQRHQQQRHHCDRQLSLDSDRSCSHRIRNAGTTTLVLACCATMGFVTFCTASGAYARRPCQYGEWPHEAGCGSLWSPRVTFLYTAFSRTLWVAAVTTLIFLLCGTQSTSSSLYDYGSEPPVLLQAVRSILSLSAWRLPSKLSFAAYLMHPIWLFVWQLGAPSSKYAWRTATFVMQYAAVCVLTFASSYVIVLVVEAPCARLWRRFIVGSQQVAPAAPAALVHPDRKERSSSTCGTRGPSCQGGGGKLRMGAGSAASKYGSVNGV